MLFFQTFREYIQNPPESSIILRHDVDKLPRNSLKFAQIQNKLGIKGSYYFRIVPQSFNPQIAELGHEIGYHYEDYGIIGERAKKARERKGDFDE